MATVNVAIVDESPSDHGDIQGSTDAVCLQLLAIKSLSKFIGLVMEEHVETISLHLTTIVVSLIPVLEDKHHVGNGPEHWAVQESREAAVSLLESLTNGGVGRILAPYFKEIPFLPSSIALENVHRALQSNGVDFDNLLVLSSATSQGRRGSLTHDGSATVGSRASSSSRSAEMIVALQKRLGMICTLLDNENKRVRSVALQHLIDLLRANRDLFHAVIENEGSASMRVYLTLIFQDSDPSETPQGGDACKSYGQQLLQLVSLADLLYVPLL
jgi:hypothetical protein